MEMPLPAFIRRWRGRFYRGPVDLGVQIPQRKGYQSPTITAYFWLRAFDARHLTDGGRAIFLVSSLALPTGMLTMQIWMKMIPFLVLALLLANMFIGYLNEARVTAERRLPGRVVAGEVATVTYTLKNLSASAGYDLLVDQLPWPKAFSWVSGPCAIDQLRGSSPITVSAEFRASQRGAYRLPALRTATAFPFHLWCWGQTSDIGSELLYVHPPFTPLSSLAIPSGEHPAEGLGNWGASRPGAGLDFLGCREFRDGDSLRQIHWLSWARTGSPVVKEYQDAYRFQALVVLDTCRPLVARWHLLAPVDTVLEGAVQMTAAILDSLSRQQASMRFLCVAPHEEGIVPVAEINLVHLFDRLASVAPAKADTFGETANRLRGMMLRGTAVYLVLTIWNESRRELVEWLRQNGVRPVVLLVTGAHTVENAPPHVRQLPAADILAGHCRQV